MDLIQRAKEKERIHFVDFTVMGHIRTQSAIDFDISFYKKARMVETGYKVMWSHILGCTEMDLNTAPDDMITMDTIYNYTATANVEGKKDRLRCANGKSWIKRMYSNAENSDLLSSVNDDFQDYKVERNILIVVSLTIVLSICLGKSRQFCTRFC